MKVVGLSSPKTNRFMQYCSGIFRPALLGSIGVPRLCQLWKPSLTVNLAFHFFKNVKFLVFLLAERGVKMGSDLSTGSSVLLGFREGGCHMGAIFMCLPCY